MKQVYVIYDVESTTKKLVCTFSDKNEAERWVKSRIEADQSNLVSNLDYLYKGYIEALKNGNTEPDMGNFGGLAVSLCHSKKKYSIETTYQYENAGEASV